MASLLTISGRVALDVFNTFTWDEEEEDNYETVIPKLFNLSTFAKFQKMQGFS